MNDLPLRPRNYETAPEDESAAASSPAELPASSPADMRDYGHDHSHGHSHAHGPAPKASKGVRIVLTVLLIPLLLASAIGMIALWPTDTPERGTLITVAEGSTMMTGTLTSTVQDDHIWVQADEEFGGEELRLMIGPEYASTDIGPGDKVRFQQIPTGDAGDYVYIFQDFERTTPMTLLAAGYALLVVLVARWRGIASIIGLVVSFGVIVAFTLPALWIGTSPVAVALITSVVVMFVVLYVAHGFTTRTSTALLGTIIGLGVTVLLAAWAVDSTNIVMLDEYLVQLGMIDERVSVKAIVLCGMVLAGLGVLNDVTITQASAVWELKTVNPELGVWELFSRGMRIGRDHIASTVYTITFAYLGASLPMLMMVSLIDQSLGFTLTSGEIAMEVVRTLIGSIGLVAAIPITTFLGALVLTVGKQENLKVTA